MRTKIGFTAVALLVAIVGLFAGKSPVKAGEIPSASGYKVLAPIRHGNLTVFPVVAQKNHDTSDFLTLDEGLRSGEVVVSEYGSIRPMMRRRPFHLIPEPSGGAEVNRLVLVNNAKRPLLLLAGEIVTGGKQDRVIGKDRLVPAESDPIDLSVFCVEPGRWVGTSSKFGAGYRGGVVPMAAPGVRSKAMADKDQTKVWAEVRKAQNEVVAGMAPSAPTAAVELQSTSSYARVMDNEAVRKQVDSIAVPIENSYRGLMKQLRDQNALGVVVAVNGEIIWADIFASTDLLQKYWPKLVRSYASEAMVTRAKSKDVDERSAQAFLDHLAGKREVVESEPGLYRHTEITGEDFKAFQLTSLLPKTGFDLHLAKMAD
jgi:ARG/rhodanese/phosphatase superfamily protein